MASMASVQDNLVATVFAGIAIVLLAGMLLAGMLLGRVARRLGQPVVIGEIVAGIALGPSLLGLLPGDLPEVLFPRHARPLVSAVSQVGLVIVMSWPWPAPAS